MKLQTTIRIFLNHEHQQTKTKSYPRKLYKVVYIPYQIANTTNEIKIKKTCKSTISKVRMKKIKIHQNSKHPSDNKLKTIPYSLIVTNDRRIKKIKIFFIFFCSHTLFVHILMSFKR